MGSTRTVPPTVSPTRMRLPVVIVAAVIVIAVCTAGLVINEVDQERRDMQTDRIKSRNAVAAQFLSAYVEGLARHETELAKTTLAGPVTPELFDRVSTENGFAASVLLNGDAELLAVSPPAAKLLGRPLPSRYAHLDGALAGEATASNVVMSAAEGKAIIAIAVPFDGLGGPRVFSAGYAIDATPLSPFTDNVQSLPTSRTLLVDGAGRIVTSSDPAIDAGSTIDQWPEIAAAASETGVHAIAGQETYSVVGAVPGTPWQLVFTVSTEALFAPISGPGKLVPWGILAAFTAAAVVALVMWRRAQLERASRLGYERQLHELAMSDALTGLGNRRVAVERLQQALGRAHRTGDAVAVLYVDIDKFKAVNDCYGHAAGDAVLIMVADRMRATFRGEDTIARLGGDEFAVICENLTDPAAVDVLVRRTREALALPYPFGDMILSCSGSVGVTTAVAGDTPEVVLARADRAMYDVKAGPFQLADAQPLTPSR